MFRLDHHLCRSFQWPDPFLAMSRTIISVRRADTIVFGVVIGVFGGVVLISWPAARRDFRTRRTVRSCPFYNQHYIKDFGGLIGRRTSPKRHTRRTPCPLESYHDSSIMISQLGQSYLVRRPHQVFCIHSNKFIYDKHRS